MGFPRVFPSIPGCGTVSPGLNEDEAVLLLRGCAWDVAVFNEASLEHRFFGDP